jgi:penicillin amidase
MARNWGDFTAALEDFHSPQQSILYADVLGNIGFYAPGRVPLRKSGDGTAPVPGWSGEFDWTGYIPFDQLPHAFNPPSGRAVTANQKIVEDGYPHFLSSKWRAPYRARRIHAGLGATEKHDLQSMTVLQSDSVSLMARELLPLMLTGEGSDDYSTGGSSKYSREALALLEGWDAVMDRNRPEPLIFSSWLFHLQKRMATDELGELYDDARRTRPGFLAAALRDKTVSGHHWCDDGTTAERESCAHILRLSLDDALAALRKTYGDRIEAWRWGDAHRLSFANPLLSRLPLLGFLATTTVETDGGNETINRGAYRSNESGTVFTHFHGAGLRVVYDLSRLGDSLFMIAPGQSGNVFSRHFNDLVQPWRDGRYLRFPADLGKGGEPGVRLRLNL